MAPIRKRQPSAQPSNSQSSRQSRKHSGTRYSGTGDVFKVTKEDKRRIKHSSLLSRIEKSSAKSTRRRRPSKKLVANLESLLDALPNTPSLEHASAEGDTRVRHKSLKSKPGAMKLKMKLEKSEMNRFSMNLAQLSTVTVGEDQAASNTEVPQAEANKTGGSQRWAALRGYIEATLDRDFTRMSK